jgi:hypothetical protein
LRELPPFGVLMIAARPTAGLLKTVPARVDIDEIGAR